MRNPLSQRRPSGRAIINTLLGSLLLRTPGTQALTQTPVPSADLDLSSLGRVALAGDFDSISIYSYVGQTEKPSTNNGSQSLWTEFPNGAFQNLGMSDAYINSLCSFVTGGKLAGVILAGNFTSIAGLEAQSVALFNPDSGEFSPLNGLDGTVYSVYCDASANTVYFGGSFVAPGAVNAMAWVTNWTALPFSGFNGPVNAITKLSNGNIVFGGQFDGLGNMTGSDAPLNSQVIPLGSGNITTAGTTTTIPGFENPNSIICQPGIDGPGSTWLIEDGIPGWWGGAYDFGYNPTKLRLYNTGYEGRGTKTFYFEDLNSGGILNLVYTDSNGKNQSCSSVCPLPQSNGTGSHQDFYFVPSVGMSEFRVWITGWYGAGGGLAGIEMFQDDLYSFAVNEFNEPQCDAVSNASVSTNAPAGLWYRVANNGTSSSDWLAADLTTASQLVPSTHVIFQPNVPQSGNYSILMYTPGCLPSNTCSTRGTVNVTGTVTSTGAKINTLVTQTNDYDKFDQIYYGPVDAATGGFRPEITLSPMPGQTLPITIVAQRVRFDIVSSSGGLNGLYEYNPSLGTVNTDFSQSAVDAAGAKLDPSASINALQAVGDELYVGGMFTSNGMGNIMTIGTQASALANNGLNDAVLDFYLDGTSLYVGGNFSQTMNTSVSGLNNIAVYDTSSKQWSALGAGVNGAVTSLVGLSLNVTANRTQSCVAVTGQFTQIKAFGDNSASAVEGFAVWVIGDNNWLSNIESAIVRVEGDLLASTNVPGYKPVFAGDISSQVLGLTDAVELSGSGTSYLETLGIKLDPTTTTSSGSSTVKRDIMSGRNFSGVYTGIFYNDNNLNLTILGGQFSVTSTDGSTVQDLIFINNTNSNTQTVTGFDGLNSGSTIAALATYESTLYAGGSLTGTVHGNSVTGLVAYDLSTGIAVSPQPPSLNGADVIVNAIAVQPDSANVYFGGQFGYAGSLPCNTLCYYDASALQWNVAGNGLTGVITNMIWSSKTTLIIAGDLAINGNKTYMATLDASKDPVFTPFTGASTLPGPISVLDVSNSNYDDFWASGIASNNGSTYLSHYANNAWTTVSGLGSATTIRGLQVMSLTSNHDSTDFLPDNMALMVVGNIDVHNFGNASAALFNGTTFQPFLLTNKDDGSQGTIASIFVSNPQALLSSGGHHLALGLVVLIGLAIALGLICLIVAAGILIERHRRRSQGYVPMPAISRNGAFSRVPPETLFGEIAEKTGPPKV